MTDNTTALVVSAQEYPVDFAISAWLHAKQQRSQSARTRGEYAAHIEGYRAAVRASAAAAAAGVDLFDIDTTVLATIAQAWAARPRARDGHAPAPATINIRLAAVSSFYRYCRRMGYTKADNPIERIERASVETYAAARPMAYADVAARMAAIEQTTAIGRRDRAILAISLATGRRLSEVAGLRIGDVEIRGARDIQLTFRRAKGGKVMVDQLPAPVASLVYTFLVADCDWTHPEPADPIWVSYSGPSATRGTALGTRSVERIAAKRLGVSKFHATRHTFARAMEDAGAKVSDIQARLGHSSLAVTGRYLAALRSADNPFGDAVAAMLGLDAG